jgi:hypothetical protein
MNMFGNPKSCLRSLQRQIPSRKPHELEAGKNNSLAEEEKRKLEEYKDCKEPSFPQY